MTVTRRRGSKPKPIVRQQFVESVADALRALLSAHKRGEAIPPVTELTERLGVSRTLVRTALKELAASGHIHRDGRSWRVAKVQRGRRQHALPAPEQLISHQSLAEQAAAGVVRFIKSEGLGEGDPLPSIGDLADAFDVSIVVMREALVDLVARGMLARRQGREMTVALPRHELISAILEFRAYLDRIDGDEFQSCRAGLEVRAAELAATQGTAARRRELLEPLVDGMQDAKSEAEFNAYDLEFHLTIARLSGNRAIEMLLASLNDLVRFSLSTTYRRVSARSGRKGIQVAIANHARIADAIVAGNAAASARAMTEHFRYVLSDSDGK